MGNFEDNKVIYKRKQAKSKVFIGGFNRRDGQGFNKVSRPLEPRVKLG